jgi:hypothetical protein
MAERTRYARGEPMIQPRGIASARCVPGHDSLSVARTNVIHPPIRRPERHDRPKPTITASHRQIYGDDRTSHYPTQILAVPQNLYQPREKNVDRSSQHKMHLPPKVCNGSPPTIVLLHVDSRYFLFEAELCHLLPTLIIG